MSEQELSYERRGVVDAAHGDEYRIDITTLVNLRCENQYRQRTHDSGVQNFSVANNMNHIGALDDVVIRVQYLEGSTVKTKLIFVLCKHVANVEKNSYKLSQRLLGRLYIQNYFDSFLKIFEIFSGQNTMKMNYSRDVEQKAKTDLMKFFNCEFSDCVFVFYSNIKLTDKVDSDIFKTVPRRTECNITDKLLGTGKTDIYLRINENGKLSLECSSQYESLKQIFCEKFIIMLDQENELNNTITTELKSLLPNNQSLQSLEKLIRDEVKMHFNASTSATALSQIFNLVEKIEAYHQLKTESGSKIKAFKRNESFERMFTRITIERLETTVLNSLEYPVDIITKFKELKMRKIVQCFHTSATTWVLFINNAKNKERWILARETITLYNKIEQVIVCSQVLIDLESKPNEKIIQIISPNSDQNNCILDFDEFSQDTKNLLQCHQICFQGKPHQSVKNICGGTWKIFFDEQLICKVLENVNFKSEIGKPFLEMPDYINRLIQIGTIEKEKFSQLKQISCNSNEKMKFILLSEKNKPIPGVGKAYACCDDLEQARAILVTIPASLVDTIHLCEYSSQSLELIHSCGRKSRVEKPETFDQSALIPPSNKRKITIISDAAGMGKTTVLRNLALQYKEQYPYYWVFFIELKQCQYVLKEFEIKEELSAVVEFVAKKILQLENREFRMFVASCNEIGNVALIFDGFDEIPDYHEEILLILKKLKETEIKSLYVSCRREEVDKLEKAFHQNSIHLVPFDEDNRNKIILQQWKTMLKNINEYNYDEEQMMTAMEDVLNGIKDDAEEIKIKFRYPRDIIRFSEKYYTTFKKLLENEIDASEIKIDLSSASSDAMNNIRASH